MKKIFFIMCCAYALFANEFYAQLEPVESFTVKSSVSGKVVFSNTDIEGKKANNTKIIEIDSAVDKVDLEQSLIKLNTIDQMIKIEDKNYNRLLQVSSKSGFEKDTQKLKVVNYQITKADILIKIANLKESIKNKKLVEKSNYIYNIAVKEGDYVSPGTLLYESKDLSQGKLAIYVPISDIETIKNKKIVLDGQETSLKIDKIYDVADSKHISSYKVEIVVDAPKIFSRLVKIEFK